MKRVLSNKDVKPGDVVFRDWNDTPWKNRSEQHNYHLIITTITKTGVFGVVVQSDSWGDDIKRQHIIRFSVTDGCKTYVEDDPVKVLAFKLMLGRNADDDSNA